MQAAVGGAAPHLEPASSSSPLRYGPSLAADELCEARAAPQSYLGLMPSEVFATHLLPYLSESYVASARDNFVEHWPKTLYQSHDNPIEGARVHGNWLYLFGPTLRIMNASQVCYELRVQTQYRTTAVCYDGLIATIPDAKRGGIDLWPLPTSSSPVHVPIPPLTATLAVTALGTKFVVLGRPVPSVWEFFEVSPSTSPPSYRSLGRLAQLHGSYPTLHSLYTQEAGHMAVTLDTYGMVVCTPLKCVEVSLSAVHTTDRPIAIGNLIIVLGNCHFTIVDLAQSPPSKREVAVRQRVFAQAHPQGGHAILVDVAEGPAAVMALSAKGEVLWRKRTESRLGALLSAPSTAIALHGDVLCVGLNSGACLIDTTEQRDVLQVWPTKCCGRKDIFFIGSFLMTVAPDSVHCWRLTHEPL